MESFQVWGFHHMCSRFYLKTSRASFGTQRRHSISNRECWLLSCVWLFVTPWTVTRQAPLSMGLNTGVGSFQFSHSVVSDSLRPHELQHARPPGPSSTPGVHPNSCPSSQWCHPTISSSVVPFSSCPQPLPASESFPMSQLFAWGGQSIGVSASASVLPMNTQDWSPLEWTGWISLKSKGLSRVFSNSTVQKPYPFSRGSSQPRNWSPTSQADSLPSDPPRKPITFVNGSRRKS